MSLPKLLIRVFRPFVVGLSLFLIVISYEQYQRSEALARSQSEANVKIASALVWAQIEATFGKVALLQDEVNNNETDDIATQMLTSSYLYEDIIQFTPQSQHYRSLRNLQISPSTLDSIKWHTFKVLSKHYSVSTIYQKNNGHWVFAVREENISHQTQVWIEFDVQHITQYLSSLKTLESGYVFVIDSETRRLVFHPDPTRIGARSVSYSTGLSDYIEQGQLRGVHDYYYKGSFKISVYDASNPMRWVFVSGTNHSDILTISYQYTLAALVILSILLITLSTHYVNVQLNCAFNRLRDSQDIANFKHQLRSIFERFVHHNSMQFCLFNNDKKQFETVDYYGNKQVVLTCENVPGIYLRGELIYRSSGRDDELAKVFKIEEKHYIMPLFSNEKLIGVIYLKATFSTFNSLLRRIRDFAEVTLANLLLTQSLHTKDQFSGLENKQAMINSMSGSTMNGNRYFALFRVKSLSKIERDYGEYAATEATFYLANLLVRSFPKPKSQCIAHFENGIFAMLFDAIDEQDAKEQLRWFKELIDKKPANIDGEVFNLAISVGMTAVTHENSSSAIEQARQALSQAEISGGYHITVM